MIWTFTKRTVKARPPRPRIVRDGYGHGAAMGFLYRARVEQVGDRWRCTIDRYFTSWTPQYDSFNRKDFATREEAEEWGNGRLDGIAAPLDGEVVGRTE